MTQILSVTIMGDPIPKARPRSGGGVFYTPKRTVDAETRIRTAAQAAYGKAPYEGPIGVDVTFYCATRRHTDGDNLLKLVTDALQRGKRREGGVFLDDAQIEDWHCRLHRRSDGQEPRTVIEVYSLDAQG